MLKSVHIAEDDELLLNSPGATIAFNATTEDLNGNDTYFKYFSLLHFSWKVLHSEIIN